MEDVKMTSPQEIWLSSPSFALSMESSWISLQSRSSTFKSKCQQAMEIMHWSSRIVSTAWRSSCWLTCVVVPRWRWIGGSRHWCGIRFPWRSDSTSAFRIGPRSSNPFVGAIQARGLVDQRPRTGISSNSWTLVLVLYLPIGLFLGAWEEEIYQKGSAWWGLKNPESSALFQNSVALGDWYPWICD